MSFLKFFVGIRGFFILKLKRKRCGERKGEKGILKRKISLIYIFLSVNLKYNYIEQFACSRNFQA
jgi:hypothetical protein